MTPAAKAARLRAVEAATQPRSEFDGQFRDFHHAVTPATVLALLDDVARLWEALAITLDHVDYTNGACGATEMVAGALPVSVIKIARAALEPRA